MAVEERYSLTEGNVPNDISHEEAPWHPLRTSCLRIHGYFPQCGMAEAIAFGNLFSLRSFLGLLRVIINFAAASRYLFDSAKLNHIYITNNKLPKCATLTLRNFFENEEVGTERKFRKIHLRGFMPHQKCDFPLFRKWSMLVLCVLSENEATRFNAIGKAIPDISLRY